MSGQIAQIEKLNGENYSVWVVQMKSLLVTMDLWDAVIGTEVAAANSSKLDMKALATITLCVKSSELIHIKDCQTANDAWRTLNSLYKRDAPARKVNLFKKLVRFKFKKSEKFASQLNEFCTVVDELKSIKIEMPDDFLSILLLCSLPEELESFVVAIESRDNLPKLDILKAKILEEEQRQGEKCVSNLENVFTAYSRQEERHVNKGNVKNQKYVQQQKYTSNSKLPNEIKCYKCGRRGHIRSQCKSSCNFLDESLAMGINENFANGNVWILDSGASSHMCRESKFFSKIEKKTHKIMLASGEYIMAEGMGTVEVKSINNVNISLQDVWYVPKLHSNFLSISKIVNAGYIVQFKEKIAEVKTKQNRILYTAKMKDDIYYVNFKLNFKLEKLNMIETNKNDNLKKWHQRYGHLNINDLYALSKNDMVRGLKLSPPKNFECSTCAVCKIRAKSYTSYSKVYSTDVLQLVHTDLCGPMRHTSEGGSKYFISFIDDYSRYLVIYFLKKKSDAFQVFKQYKAEMENMTGRKIKCIRSDNGLEYVNGDFSRFLVENGISHQTTCPYSPQQNGVAERANRTLVEMSRCLLENSKLPQYLWAEAVNTASYIRNRSPTKMLNGKTPYELWVGRKPSVKHFKIFGCQAVVLQKGAKNGKFEPKGIKLTFIGYENYSKGYRLYDLKNRKFYKARDVIFFEDTFDNKLNDDDVSGDFFSAYFEYQDEHSKNKEIAENAVIGNNEFQENDDVEELPTEQDANVINFDEEEEDFNIDESNAAGKRLRGRPRIHRTGNVGRPRKVFVTESGPEMLNTIIENPESLKEALNSNNAEEWKCAMQREYDSLVKNQTWELVDKPKNKNIISCKWVFALKRKADGSIEKFKARLVARGCAQKYNVDFKETYAPVVRHSTIRLVLALAANYGLLVNHIDIVAAYLNGDLHNEVYMKQPVMFEDKKFPEKVCKLKRSLYGLKQAGREWNMKVNEILIQIGFQRCKTDNCVYIQRENNNINIIALYVDDLMLACSSKQQMEQIIAKLNQHVELVDRGAISFYLGMEIERENGSKSISIHQRRYTEELLKQWGMTECKPVSTPMASGTKLEKCGKENCKQLYDVKSYQSLIGGLMYLSVISRPDISHVVSRLAQFSSHPHDDHFVAAKHLLRYLKNIPKGTLTYSPNNKKLSCFTDSDWGGDINDRKSYSGYVLNFGGSPIAWESKKQNVVSLSSMEAEYIAMCQGAKEVVFQRSLLNEMGFGDNADAATTIYCDNQGAQFLVKNPSVHKRSKHIDIRFHYIREKYLDGAIDIEYVPSSDNAADILTKSLTKEKHVNCCKLLNICFK